MDVCNEFAHQSGCLGNVADRVEAGIGTTFCWTSIRENIGATWGYSSTETAILKTLFNMMYADVVCCSNWHREAILWCDYTSNTKLGFGEHYTIDNDPYEFLTAWDFVTMTYNPGCTWGTSIGTPTCAILPVELITFEAIPETNCTSVHLNADIRNHFSEVILAVQRSTDGIHWDVIYEEILPDDKEVTRIQFQDIKEITLGLFYRLVLTDSDGLETYSEIRSVNGFCKRNIQVIPHPVSGEFCLIYADWADKIRLYSLDGQKVREYSPNTQVFDMHDLPPAMYFLELADETEYIRFKLVKL